MKTLEARLDALEAKHAGPVVYTINDIMRDGDGYTVNGVKMTAAEYAAWELATDTPDTVHIRIDADTVAQNGG